jgi:twitching motility protein PilJ
MSLIDKLKGGGRQRDGDRPSDDLTYGDAYGPSDSGADSRGGSLRERPSQPGGLNSIIAEAAPSSVGQNFARNKAASASDPGLPRRDAAAKLPLLDRIAPASRKRVLTYVLVAGIVGLVSAGLLAERSEGRGSNLSAAAGQALAQSQRLARTAIQALVGVPAAFIELREASEVLSRNARMLREGAADLSAASPVPELVDPLQGLVETAEKHARTLVGQEKLLTQVGLSLRSINKRSAEMLEQVDALVTIKLQTPGTPAPEMSAAVQLAWLTQRIAKSALEAQSLQGVSPDAVALLGKDLTSFRDLSAALLDGNADLRIGAVRDGPSRERLMQLSRNFELVRNDGNTVITGLPGLAAARDAEAAILANSDALRVALEKVQDRMTGVNSFGWPAITLFLLALLGSVYGGYGLVLVYAGDQRQRAQSSEEQRLEAERQEREAKRVNDANQAAILRLMNELQSVAEGDLTQQATVTEDITGAIADSVNYTVEELRSLVAQVQGTAARVTDTTQQVETTSTELLAASDEQLREIRETGEAVLQMAGRIQRVSAQAQQSAEVARQSLNAASSGLNAVLETIGGMNAIREQIQDTSKRIKRLGESSQEIGEITELISDITEQTNVLALNAAIQAASAGEAGRGFSVVAEEVQRLAERSADATRQIAVLVKTIQTDTADAVAAMERSTQGVVTGARLSDNAGTALGEIDRISRQLSELIEDISRQARRESDSANVVAENIQHIFAVTEQTGEGTRSTAQLVRQLSRTAEELRQSVARFKIS